jgi:hypothetical protein
VRFSYLFGSGKKEKITYIISLFSIFLNEKQNYSQNRMDAKEIWIMAKTLTK